MALETALAEKDTTVQRLSGGLASHEGVGTKTELFP
jgi:uncharacterized coiled-coil protein SlyX